MKLSKKGILYRSFSSISTVAFISIFIAISIRSLVGLLAGISVFVLGISGVILYQYLYWKNYDFHFEEDDLKITSGVVTRNELDIPSRRIQNVDLEKTFVQRIIGIAEVRIETAGGNSSEASLRYLDREEAETVKEELRKLKNRMKKTDDEGTGDGESPVEASKEYELGIKNLLLLGFTSFSPAVTGLIFFLLFIAGGTALSVAEEVVSSLGLFAGGSLLLIGVAVPVMILNAAYIFLRYFDFTVEKHSDTLEYEMGMFSRTGGSIPEEKIQNIIIHENFLKRFLGLSTLKVETAGTSGGFNSGGSTTLIPVDRRENVVDYAERLGDYSFPEFENVTERSRKRYVRRYIMVSLLLFGTVSIAYSRGMTPLLYLVPLAVLLLSTTAARLKWSNIGFSLQENEIFVMKGFWIRKIYSVPYFRVQNLMITRTIFQRRWGLSTLTVDTAGSVLTNPRIVDMEKGKAHELREIIYDRFWEDINEQRE